MPFLTASRTAEAIAKVPCVLHDDVPSAALAVELSSNDLRCDEARVFPVEPLAAMRAEFCAAVVRRRHSDDRSAFHAGKTADLFSLARPCVARRDPVRPVRALPARGRAILLRCSLLLKRFPADDTGFLCHAMRHPKMPRRTPKKDHSRRPAHRPSVSLYLLRRSAQILYFAGRVIPPPLYFTTYRYVMPRTVQAAFPSGIVIMASTPFPCPLV